MLTNVIIEKNMSRYDLLVGEYLDVYDEKEMCFFSWLKNGNTGSSVTWPKGDRLDIGYLSSKVEGINIADMVGIISGLKEQLPEWIGELRIPTGYESYE